MRKPKSLALGGRAERGRSGRIERFGGQGRGRCRVRGNRARSLRRRSPESGLGGCGAVVSSRTREFGFDVILTQPFPQNRSEGNGWYFIGDHGSFPCSACEERPTKAFSQQTASAPSRLMRGTADQSLLSANRQCPEPLDIQRHPVPFTPYLVQAPKAEPSEPEHLLDPAVRRLR